MRGWVYIITNESMPGLVKVGYTDRNPEVRASELVGTGMPTRYSVAYSIQVQGPRDVERAAHRKLATVRVGREWFRCTVAKARIVVDAVAGVGDDQSGSPLVPGHALSDYFE